MEMPDLDFKFWKIKNNVDADEIRELLLRVRDKGLKKFLVLAESTMIRKLFKHGRRLGMISPSYSWIVPNLVYENVLYLYIYIIETIKVIHLFKTAYYLWTIQMT